MRLARDGPVIMKEFTTFAKLSPPYAKDMRIRMEEFGWVKVGRPERKTTSEIEISITPEGRKVVDVLLQLDQLVERAKKRRG